MNAVSQLATALQKTADYRRHLPAALVADAFTVLEKRVAYLKKKGVVLSPQARIAFVDGYQTARRDVARYVRRLGK